MIKLLSNDLEVFELTFLYIKGLIKVKKIVFIKKNIYIYFIKNWLA